MSLAFAFVPTVAVFIHIAIANIVIFIYVRNTLRPLIVLDPSEGVQDDEKQENASSSECESLRSSIHATQIREAAIQG